MATKAQVRSILREAEKKLEEARRAMVYDGSENHFTSEEVHEVALAQFATGKAREKLDNPKKSR